jgi:hypothetical protein
MRKAERPARVTREAGGNDARTDMAARQFEYIEVPITLKAKLRNIGIWSGVSAFCGLLILTGYNAKGENEHNGSVLTIFAAFGLVYGFQRIVRAILQKTERQLTKEGWIQQQAARKSYRARRQQEIQRGREQLEFWAKIGIALAVFVLFITWAWRPFADSLSSKVTVYPERCVNLNKDGQCMQGGWRPDVPTTYTVHTDQQFVVGLTDEEPAPHKLFNCVIADNSHWTCTVESSKYSNSFTLNGSDFSASNGTHYASRFDWLVAHMSSD